MGKADSPLVQTAHFFLFLVCFSWFAPLVPAPILRRCLYMPFSSTARSRRDSGLNSYNYYTLTLNHLHRCESCQRTPMWNCAHRRRTLYCYNCTSNLRLNVGLLRQIVAVAECSTDHCIRTAIKSKCKENAGESWARGGQWEN